MFAGSCIGVIALVALLEFLRRVQREYDNYNRRRLTTKVQSTSRAFDGSTPDSDRSPNRSEACKGGVASGGRMIAVGPAQRRRPGMAQLITRQSIRAFLHMCQFTVAYFIMLLAMYYNGEFCAPGFLVSV